MQQTPRALRTGGRHEIHTPLERLQLYDESSNEESRTECILDDGDGDLEFEDDADFVVGWSNTGSNYILPRGCGVTVTYKKPQGDLLKLCH
jgi:hypothetical protein